VSRRVNDTLAVLFERDPASSSGIHLDAAVPLHHHVDGLATLAALGVTPG